MIGSEDSACCNTAKTFVLLGSENARALATVDDAAGTDDAGNGAVEGLCMTTQCSPK